MNPKLSIIIPAYNEEKDISYCISSLNEQSYKKFEIIVVDDGSTDRTFEAAGKFGVRILNQNHKGPGAARNLGARNAKGEILIFIDSDMTFEKNYLKNLIAPFKDKKIIGTTHELEIVKNTDNIWSRCWGKVRVSKEESKNVKIFRAIRKKKFLELGGFDSMYGYADDQTLWFKYKIGPVVAENTVCYHKNQESLKSVYRQSKWIGSSHMYEWLNFTGINLLVVFFLFILSPISILLLAVKKVYRNKDYIIFPFMIIFMTARYFGNLSGYLRRILYRKNFR